MKKILLSILLLANISFVAEAQVQLFHGSWTRLGTGYLFDFDLRLEHGAGNQVQGFFDWKFMQYDPDDPFSASYYKDKIGLTAREYVNGTYDPTTKTYHVTGYAKDDPDAIISLDEYLLKIDAQGDIGGETRSQNTWLGRINAKSLPLQDL